MSLAAAKPSDFNFPSIRSARWRLKLNSGTLRALIAPSDLAVCPTSSTIRNFAGSHPCPAGFAGGGCSATRIFGGAAGFAFGEAACFGELACCDEAACLAGAADFVGLVCFDEPLKRSDRKPAWLISIGSSADAIIAAMTVRARSQPRKPDPPTFPPDDGNPYPPAAIRGRPTKPAASPKRSTITAGRSLALFVT